MDKWPSFVIQGIILATITSFMIKGGGYINTWMFSSLLSVLTLFSLQATSTDFLYLYPVNPNTDKKTPNYKTYILRIATMISAGCLFMGVYHPNSSKETLTSNSSFANGYLITLLIAGFFILIVPILFNFIRNK